MSIMKITFNAAILGLLLFTNATYAQQPTAGRGICGTVAPSAEWEAWFQTKITELNSNYQRDRAIVYIPVIVHVIYNKQTIGVGANLKAGQVQAQIDVLNDCLAGITPGNSSLPSPFAAVDADDIPVRFCLATVSPTGAVLDEKGIERIDVSKKGWTDPATIQGPSNSSKIQNLFTNTIKPGSIWDPTKYFNIWVGDFWDPVAGGLLGYATFPAGAGISGIVDNLGTAKNDGVVMASNIFGSKTKFSNGYYTNRDEFNYGITVAHEVGHWLGLRHISGDNSCGDDYCSDTPPQKGGHDGCANGLNWGCPSYPYQANQCKDNNGKGLNPNGEMFQNYMDYTNDNCRSLFTAEQEKRILTALANGTYRKGFTTAANSLCSVPTTIKEQAAANSVAIYPNPSSGIFTVESLSNELLQIQVYDFIGQLVYKTENGNATNKKEIDLSELPNGMYSIQILNGSIFSSSLISINK
ncbi:MAG TPA: zinc-dependent metalloprotease [Bacteroidia bacterium]|jgi:hypothetical protein|nr:zinc-dependent metalloprotease [Bacteroidia bacterium]